MLSEVTTTRFMLLEAEGREENGGFYHCPPITSRTYIFLIYFVLQLGAVISCLPNIKENNNVTDTNNTYFLLIIPLLANY